MTCLNIIISRFCIPLLLVSTLSALAQFSTLAVPSDPFAPNAYKVVRVSSVAEFSEALGKLAGDTHFLLNSGSYELPVLLKVKSYTRDDLCVRISPLAGGLVRFKGPCHFQMQADLRFELQRVHCDAVITISGADDVVVDSCRFETRGLIWMAPDSASLRIINSAFTGGGMLMVMDDGESQVSLMHNTWSGSWDSAVVLKGEGQMQLRLDNNIFSGTVNAALRSKNAHNVMLEGRNNLFHGWESIGLNGEERLMKNRMSDPLFKEDGFHLMGNSPAINAGAALGESVSVDIDGDYRGLRPDIGADEF